MKQTFELSIKALLAHLIDVGANITPNGEGKLGFMIWNCDKVKDSIDTTLVSNVDNWVLDFKEPEYDAKQGKLVHRAYLGPSNRKPKSLDELMAKAIESNS
tara:strand:- start:93 stop:395 length:303 start_codon:yes stop_codon:yes gene_type:complete